VTQERRKFEIGKLEYSTPRINGVQSYVSTANHNVNRPQIVGGKDWKGEKKRKREKEELYQHSYISYRSVKWDDVRTQGSTIFSFFTLLTIICNYIKCSSSTSPPISGPRHASSPNSASSSYMIRLNLLYFIFMRLERQNLPGPTFRPLKHTQRCVDSCRAIVVWNTTRPMAVETARLAELLIDP
jgi:hypothetical protein